MTERLHHPSQYAGMERSGDITSFRRRGGSVPAGSEIVVMARWHVSFSPITYDSGQCRNATEVMAAAWELFGEGGWTVHIWDNEKQEGWSYMNFGPECIAYLERVIGQ